MASATSITVNDGSATPVAITYVPVQLPDSTFKFTDRRKSAGSLMPYFTWRFSDSNANRKTQKVLLSFAYPLEGVVNGVAAPVDVARADVTVTLPANMAALDRSHLAAMIANSLDVALIRNTIKDLDPIY